MICAEQGADSDFPMLSVSMEGAFAKHRKLLAIPVPTNGEQLRARFKTLTIAFVIASFKQSSCPLAQGCHSQGRRRICGTLSQRARGQLPTGSGRTLMKATWATVLDYDLHMRMHAVRSILYNGLDSPLQ